MLLQGEDGKHYHFYEERFSDVCIFQWSFLDFDKKPSLGTLPFFLGSYPKAKPRPPGLLGGFGKLPEDVFRQSRGFQSTLTNFGSGRVGFGVRGASHNYFFFMVSQTGLKNKTFLWWTTFLISQRRPSYSCLKNFIEKFENFSITLNFSKLKLFPNFLVLPPTWPQTKTFLWWTIFLISQRRPSYSCLKNLTKKWPSPKNFQNSNFFQFFWFFHKLDHKLRH